MNKTKRNILDKAQEMFNEYGVKETTLRKIAQALEISQGNLNYHFKTKAEIIEDLYFELVAKMDENMARLTMDQPILSYLYASSLSTMECFFEYRFLMKDFYKLLSENQKIKKHYMGLQKLRGEQFASLFQVMINTDLIRAEEFEGEYQRLYERMTLLGDNWINAQVLVSLPNNDFIAYSCNLLFEMIYPYLTANGKTTYRNLKLT